MGAPASARSRQLRTDGVRCRFYSSFQETAGTSIQIDN